MTVPGADTGQDGKCGGKTSSGGRCKQAAGWGTSHPGVGTCKLHLGSTANHVKAASKEIARQECVRHAIPIEIDATDALIGKLHETYGWAEFYGRLVDELPVHPEPDAYVLDEDGGNGHWERGEPGLYGRTYHVSGVPTGEAKRHILVQLRDEMNDRVVAISVSALKAGIEERQIKLAEEMGQKLAAFGMELLRRAGVDPNSDQGREIFRGGLHVIQGGRA